MKYAGEIEGQYGSREDPKKLALIREIPGNTGELVTLYQYKLLKTKKNLTQYAH
jgi:hypothetical protein